MSGERGRQATANNPVSETDESEMNMKVARASYLFFFSFPGNIQRTPAHLRIEKTLHESSRIRVSSLHKHVILTDSRKGQDNWIVTLERVNHPSRETFPE